MPMLRTHPLSLYEWLRIQSTQTKLNLALSNIDAALFPCSYVVGLRPVCKISTALDLCLLCWYYTQEHQCPKESQLATALSLLDGNDTFLYAGTGFGKTLSAILHMYLKEEHEITIIITPLKRIQASHARSLEEMYGFRVLVVNEETSRDAEFWKTRIHDLRKKIPGDVQVIITTPEQLFRTPDGHYTRLGTLLREPAFKRRVRFIVVDEAHFIHTTGLALYGLSPFRKVYSRLDEIKALLGSCVPWLVLTATAPFNMLKTIESVALKPTYTTIRLALNRPNLTYACHQLVGGASCFDNFKCFLTQPFNLDLQPRVLIFVEDSAMAVQLALFLNQLLPSSLRSLRIVRHQHSNMSPQYQAETHDAFASVNGACRILISTSMEATGVDHRAIKITCVVNQRKTLADLLQAAGRTERDPNSSGLVLFFYEEWVRAVDLSKFPGDVTDTDRPFSATLTANSSARERLPCSYAGFIQTTTCRRLFFARYLNDTTPSALQYTTDHCCDNCGGLSFSLTSSLPSRLHVAAIETAPSDAPTSEVPKKRKRLPIDQTRSKLNSGHLKDTLEFWLHGAQANDPLRAVRPVYFILQPKDITTLSKARPYTINTINSASDVVSLLGQTTEWGGEWAEDIFELVRLADDNLREERQSAKRQKGEKGQVQRVLVKEESDSENEPLAMRTIKPVAKTSQRRTLQAKADN